MYKLSVVTKDETLLITLKDTCTVHDIVDIVQSLRRVTHVVSWALRVD